VEHGREPCPDRIVDDIGGAFGMGALGGGLWHTYRGLKNSPKGYKIVGALEVCRVRPVRACASAPLVPGRVCCSSAC
jgi:import inner membrane translocase subunit TIM17